MKCGKGQSGHNGKIKPPESNIQRAAKTLQMLTNTSIRSGGLNTICFRSIQLRLEGTLTLSRVAPSVVSKGVGGLWFQILVTTSSFTQIDTRQRDLQLSDT